MQLRRGLRRSKSRKTSPLQTHAQGNSWDTQSIERTQAIFFDCFQRVCTFILRSKFFVTPIYNDSMIIQLE